MIKHRRKVANLPDELLRYALQSDPQKVVATIERLAGEVRITVEDDGVRRREEERRQTEDVLNAPCRNEMKDYYGGLVGEETIGLCRLRMVGMVVDGARVEASEGGTRVSVWWAEK